MNCSAILSGAVALTLLVAGCSSGPKVTVPTPSPSAKSATASATSSPTSEPEPESTSEEASAPLDGETCVEVTGASLDLSAATNTDEARTAADTLEKYDPSASAKTAIEHFVTTGGAQIDDSDFSKYNDDLDKWVHEVCPPV